MPRAPVAEAALARLRRRRIALKPIPPTQPPLAARVHPPVRRQHHQQVRRSPQKSSIFSCSHNWQSGQQAPDAAATANQSLTSTLACQTRVHERGAANLTERVQAAVVPDGASSEGLTRLAPCSALGVVYLPSDRGHSPPYAATVKRRSSYEK